MKVDAKVLADKINNAECAGHFEGGVDGNWIVLRAEEQNLIVDALRQYVPDLVSDNYNDLAVLYVAGPNATWRAWAEARMVVILKKADAWHPELNPNGVNERPLSGPLRTPEDS